MLSSAPRSRKRRGEVARRILVAAVGVPLATLIVWLGGWFLGTVMALVAALSAREFFALAEARGGRPLVVPGTAFAVALPLLATELSTFSALAPWVFGAMVLITLLVLGGAVWARGVEGSPMSSATATVVGAVYTGGTLAFSLLLRDLPEATSLGGGTLATGAGQPGGLFSAGLPPAVHGGALVAFPITVTWIGDSVAYFAGRRWGRRKLVPRISPGKTVVGGVAGLVAAVVTSVSFALVFMDSARPFGVGVPAAALMGLLIGVAAQVGDLTESVLKREAGVKDSGSVLPGHGGVLDRFDALFFTIPLGYLLVSLNAQL